MEEEQIERTYTRGFYAQGGGTDGFDRLR
jgi:hypothetical protein